LGAVEFSLYRAFRQVITVENKNDGEFLERCFTALYGPSVTSYLKRVVRFQSTNGRKNPQDLARILEDLWKMLPPSDNLKVICLQDSDQKPDEVIQYERQFLKHRIDTFNNKREGKIEFLYHCWPRVEPENYVLDVLETKYPKEFEKVMTNLSSVADVQFLTKYHMGLSEAVDLSTTWDVKLSFDPSRVAKNALSRLEKANRKDIVDGKEVLTQFQRMGNVKRNFALLNLADEFSQETLPKDIQQFLKEIVGFFNFENNSEDME